MHFTWDILALTKAIWCETYWLRLTIEPDLMEKAKKELEFSRIFTDSERV